MVKAQIVNNSSNKVDIFKIGNILVSKETDKVVIVTGEESDKSPNFSGIIISQGISPTAVDQPGHRFASYMKEYFKEFTGTLEIKRV
jgi:hypothetical protein